MNKNKPSLKERVVMLLLLAAILLIFAFFLKDILIPFLRLELRNDVEGARELLVDKGWLGFFTVTLVEALQMVVIFVPAEFIQISSGLSYPFYIALLLCDLGVCLGASIIFVLVRTFHVHNEAYEMTRRRIDRLSAGVHDRNAVLFMYGLFFMPIVPFGAICYYGSGTKLSYGRYIRTVALGAIPSIVASNLMGEAGKLFLLRDLSLGWLILVIVLLAAALFALIFVLLQRCIFKESDGTPDSPVYALIFFIVRLWHGRRPRPVIDDTLLREVDAPYMVLANHQSFFDFYYIYQMDHPRNPTFLVNEFYCTRPVLRSMAKRAGILSKKLFTPEMAPAMTILRTLRRGYPVVIFPEGRLSPDGRTNPIAEPGGAFYRRLGVDLVLVKIRGAYFSAPKWRKRRYRSEVRLTVEEVIRKDELRAMSGEELDRRIERVLWNDESASPVCAYPQKDKAAGLENVLYRCPDCGGLYTVTSRGNELRCGACGSVHALGDDYRFSAPPYTIGEWYDTLREAEKPLLGDFRLETEVDTLIHGANGGPNRKERGTCILDPGGFAYRSDSVSFSVPMDKLPALAYSSGAEFELYHENELYYFYPTAQRQQCARWARLVDLLAQRRREGETT